MTVQTWPICLGADPGFAKGEGTDHGEHAECEHVKGVWRSPRQGSGAELLVGNEGRSSLKLKAFYPFSYKRGARS